MSTEKEEVAEFDEYLAKVGEMTSKTLANAPEPKTIRSSERVLVLSLAEVQTLDYLIETAKMDNQHNNESSLVEWFVLEHLANKLEHLR